MLIENQNFGRKLTKIPKMGSGALDRRFRTRVSGGGVTTLGRLEQRVDTGDPFSIPTSSVNFVSCNSCSSLSCILGENCIEIWYRIFFVKTRKFGQKSKLAQDFSKFWQKISIKWSKFRSKGQNEKFWSKVESFVKNRNFGRELKFRSKIEIKIWSSRFW